MLPPHCTHHVTTCRQVPGETQMLLMELADNSYGLLLPLLDSGRFRATLRPPVPGGPPDRLVLRVESGMHAATAAAWPSACYVAAGDNPWALLEHGVATAARLSGSAYTRAEKVVPEFANVFGWCERVGQLSVVGCVPLVLKHTHLHLCYMPCIGAPGTRSITPSLRQAWMQDSGALQPEASR